jgi:hypothetical protein
MQRSHKVELLEQIRRQFGEGKLAGVAREFGVRRQMVRQALANALPPERKVPLSTSPQIERRQIARPQRAHPVARLVCLCLQAFVRGTCALVIVPEMAALFIQLDVPHNPG